MKKVFSFFATTLFFLTASLIFPSPSLAIDLGDSCSTPYEFSNCQAKESVTGKKETICCQCLDGKWQYALDQPCSEVETAAEIYNPALKTFGTGKGATIIAQIIANALKIIFAVSGLVLLVMLLIGGFQWMTAGGNKETLATAQKRISSALIGFVIFISVFAIVNYLLPALGINLKLLEIEWPTP